MVNSGTVFALAFGAGGSAYALFTIGCALRASRWPYVMGEIAQTRLVHVQSDDGPTIEPYVAYRYEVGGMPYRNDRIRFGPQVTPISSVPQLDPEPRSRLAKAVLEREYPRGQPVRVYYNPGDPADSVLYPAADWTVYVLLILSVIFAYAGATKL